MKSTKLNSKDILLSIVIPAYNEKDTIVDTIEAVVVNARQSCC